MSDKEASEVSSSSRSSNPVMNDNHADCKYSEIQPKTSTSCSTRLFQQWSSHCKMLIVLLEKLFETFALFVSKKPFYVILSTLFLAAFLTLGFTQLDAETNVKYLFLPENSQASRDIVRAKQIGFELDVRQAEIILLPKQNETLLSQKCMREMIEIHEKIVQIDQYEKYCFRPNADDNCVSTNLLELFDYNKTKLDNITGGIETALENDAFLMSNGKRLTDNFNSIFGKQSSKISLHSTNALRMVYFMTEHYSGKQRADILKWESTFIEEMSTFSKNTTCVDIFFSAERSLDDSVAESTGSDIKFFAVTFTIMGVFSSVVNGRCADARYGHQLLGFSALLAIYLGVTSALGLLMFAGVPFVSMVGVLPFLVVSIGIDDVFIILHELNEVVRKHLPAAHMLSGTMARSGPTITMTTLTDLVAFAVSCRSLFPAVRFFCGYAALALTFAFLMLVTFFVGCMWFDVKRIKAKRRDFLPCFKSPPPRECCSGIRRNALDNGMKAWGRILTGTLGKTLVCLFSVLLLTSGIYGALHVDESFSRQLLTTKGSNYRRFLDVYEEHFYLDIEIDVIVPGQLDYSSYKIQQKYLDLKAVAKSNEYFKEYTISWLSEFLKWAKSYNLDTNNTKSFYKNLQHFLSLPNYKRFNKDLKFSENRTRITASRIFVYSKSNPDSEFQRDMMISLREDLSRSSDLDAFAVALQFIYFEQYAHVLHETIRNLVISGISILVISSFFLNHPMIILCLLFGFVALIIELLGLMYLWDVSVNSISMIVLVMALGFSVDYNAHIAYHFVSSKERSPELRVVDALNSVGGSVFLGGLSTFLGMMTTGFASSIIFQTFFKMFMGIVVLGLLHGLVILPVYLTLLGKVFDLHVPEATFEQLLKVWYSWKKSGKNSSDRINQKKVLDSNLSRKYSPVAVVGIGCRFPGGAKSKDDFWNMLVEGRCGIDHYPANRPDAREFEDTYNPEKNTPGKHYVLTGAFLDEILGFDAQFFGISSTECRTMDPQQRLLLHVVYEAIEDAGIRLTDLQQCRTGVYVGLMNLDYGTLITDTSNIRKLDQFASTGSTSSIAANRISFSLNLTGPSLTVDTACSSSLTALHLAFGHLQTGECDAAIVCAPNILLSSRFHTACCRSGLLAQDGRCKSFDIKGDGYGRGEGIAAVVLKPTTTAIQDRDDIYAEIIASGLNNDGQSAIPMTSPCAATQAILFQRVLHDSGLSKDDIQYVEAHGTGTAIGDVVEMGSISAVYGNSNSRVLRVGSVKSNINHTESTAGIAGLIKTCLMIKNEHFVPTINVHEVKPQLKMSERQMMVQVHNEPWKAECDKPRIAAVCSYGYGGTNANVILQEVTQSPVSIIPSGGCLNRVMTLSASSNDALKAMAKKYSESIKTKSDDDELLKDNICYSLNERYTLHSHRLAVTFRSFKQATKALEMFAEQEKGWQEVVSAGDATIPCNKVAFLYGGQGGQWYGMAREMITNEPKFKESIEKIDQILKRQGVPWSLMAEFNKPEETSRMKENPIGQTVLFAVQFALTEVLKSWGITPSAVVGHSLGEITAACASGALSLTEALQLVLIRSQLHENCSSAGCMAAVGMSEDDARSMLQQLHLENQVDIAVINSPIDVVLSGDEESIKLVESHVCENREDVFWKTIGATRAFHSHEMEKLKESFTQQATKVKLRPRQGNVPFYSTVTGTKISGKLLSQEHWWKNVRQTVLLSHALKAMFTDDYRTFVEISASPQLSRHVHQTWSRHQKAKTESHNDVAVIATLPKRSASDQHKSFLQNCVAHLFTRGFRMSWNRIQGSGSKCFIRRPTYPWQESEFWYREICPIKHVSFSGEKINEEEKAIVLNESHPLLGKCVSTKAFSGLHVWESEIDLHRLPYLKDHTFADSLDPIVPGAVYIEIVLAMVLHMFPQGVPDVQNITFNKLLAISSSDSFIIRSRLYMDKCSKSGNRYQITRVQEDENEVVLSEGSVKLDIVGECYTADSPATATYVDLETIKARMVKVPPDYLDKTRKSMGFQFGAQFSLITEAWFNDLEALATICPTEEIRTTSSAYVIHPSIIDACFQSLFFIHSKGKFVVPYRMENVTIFQKITSDPLFSHAKAVQQGEKENYNITLMDCYGRAVMLINGYVNIDLSALHTTTNFENAAFKLEWKEDLSTPKTRTESTEEKTLIILQDNMGYAKQFMEYWPKSGNAQLVNMHDTPDEICTAFSESLKQTMRKRKTTGNREKLLIINFWPVDASQLGAETQNFLLSHRLSFETSLLIVQEILKKENIVKEIQLVFVTSGVVSMVDVPTPDCFTPEEFQPVFPWASTVFGFRRTFSEEINVPKASVIDLPRNPNVIDFQHMVEDLREAVISEEIAYRNGLRYVNRLVKLKPCDTKFTEQASPISKSGKPKAFKLSFVSDNLVLRQINGLQPELCSTLEVYVARPLLDSHWTSLTTHDRIAVAGKLRNESDQGESEDLVVGVCKAGYLGSYVVAKECCCFTKIHHAMTAQQAASLCFPMAMSYYLIKDILIDVKQKKILVYHKEEETCCIFACVALSLEASIVSLAKDKQGRDRLKHFGVPEVFTEYEMIIGEEVQEMNLDAVFFLSKPRRSVVRQVMKHLKSGGKVISVFNNEFHILHEKDVNFLMTSLDYVTKNSETFSSLLASCIDVLASRELFQKLLNIPHVLTSIYDLVKSDSTHVSNQLEMEGKSELLFRTVCLKSKHTPEKVEFYTLAFDSNGLRRDRTYLVVGGIRGFGFEVAKWMVENGAKTVMCTARSPPSEEKKIEVQRLEQETGSRIILRQADVTSWTNMTAIKDELEALPNVAGIVFSAMVLEDQLIKEADLETCKRVISTKVAGSVLLHQLSLSMSLDFFIMFSSISGTLGNVGQVSYAAANTFLDYLCEYRRYKLGLPALAVNWGPISGAGVLERNKDVAVLLEKQGFYSLHTNTAMEFLRRILLKNSNEAQVCICHMSWPVYLRTHVSPRLQLIRDETSSFNVLQKITTLKELNMQSLESRITYVKEFITDLLASWSEADVTEVDLNVGLYKYGIDSIGAANMAIQIQNGLGVSFETFYLVQAKTSGLSIINDILERIDNEREIDEDETNDDNTSSSTAVIGDILDENKEHNDANIELQTINIKEKVIPLYLPEDAAVKVFMTHSSHKSAMANAAFSRGFEQQALVSFYSVGMDDYTRYHTSDYGTVQTLAKKYLELIKNEQPWGPYYLAGYSFGGTLVYEIASLLMEQDEEVAMVFMLDTAPWFPKALAYGRQLYLCQSKMFLQNVTKLVTKQMIQKLAYIHLGISPTELDEMSAEFSDENELISVLEQKAAEKDVPLHLREEVDALQYQLRGAMEAHNDWEPPKVRYRGPLTYGLCEKTNISSLFWNGPQMWKSLSGRMDLYIVPGHHIEQIDEIHGKLDGSLMMTTAAMKYRTRYSMFNLLGFRSKDEKRLVDWLKQGVNISMYLKDSPTLLKGTFWLDHDETVLTFVSERMSFSKKRKVILKDLNNILPGKYVKAIQKSKLHKVYADLIICMISNKGKLYNIRCSDWEERNQLMDSLDALFGIPFVRINN